MGRGLGELLEEGEASEVMEVVIRGGTELLRTDVGNWGGSKPMETPGVVVLLLWWLRSVGAEKTAGRRGRGNDLSAHRNFVEDQGEPGEGRREIYGGGIDRRALNGLGRWAYSAGVLWSVGRSGDGLSNVYSRLGLAGHMMG